jgi:hypothetical protein
MGVLTRVIHACLRFAVGRWPAELREDLFREWLAELAALDGQPGAAWRRLWFAVSLAADPRTYDENGPIHRPWLWWRGASSAAGMVVGLLLTAGFGFGLWVGVGKLLETALLHARDSNDMPWYLWSELAAAAGAAAVTSGYGAVACRWLGRRHAYGSQRSRIWADAVTAVGAFGIVLLGWHRATTESVASQPGGGLMPTVTWASATFLLVVVTSHRVGRGRSRQGWVLALAGAPLAAALGPALAAPTPDGDLGPPVSWQIMMDASWLLPLTVSVVSFGWAAARTRSAVAGSSGLTAEPVAGAPPPRRDETSAAADHTVSTWRPRAALLVVTVAAAGAAVLWAIGTVLLQPSSEPPAGSVGENNTYWARELRWSAIMAIVLAVVVCAGARRQATRLALAGGLACLAIDIWLDRTEPSLGTVPLSIAAAAVAVGGCYQATASRGRPHRAGLLVVAGVAAILSAVALLTESPSDTEPALNPGSAAASSALALVAIGAALSLTVRSSWTGRAAACLAIAFAGTTPWLLRHWYPRMSTERLLVAFAFAALLVLLVAVVAWGRPDTPGQWLRFPAVFIGAVLTFPLLLMPVLIAVMIFGVCRPLTALAGNPPIHAADSDVIYVLPATLAGLVLGLLLTIAAPHDRPRDPDPDEPPPTSTNQPPAAGGQPDDTLPAPDLVKSA